MECPVCESDDTECLDMDMTDSEIITHWNCNNCEKDWDVTYYRE